MLVDLLHTSLFCIVLHTLCVFPMKIAKLKFSMLMIKLKLWLNLYCCKISFVGSCSPTSVGNTSPALSLGYSVLISYGTCSQSWKLGIKLLFELFIPVPLFILVPLSLMCEIELTELTECPTPILPSRHTWSCSFKDLE